ncbi:exopolysaccharide biosynthesis protein [Devosia sp. ZB163]|uniref:exopolysaccharide biosynthesis protein n=1 Tax=Devosia sp. ZB163 TaxID=3025938 RepID=UPI00235EAA58|nr:exopolysaccharide biosynthesis protein [Devosia sp. ZB163]MDC9826147.1 exopolysaccharide biosynthesis protein [Devosia sp. ZB163]
MTQNDIEIDLSHVDQAEGADRLSAILTAIAAAEEKERISIGDLLEALRRRALGALIFIFAVPTALPMPPGLSTIVGAPLLFLTLQLMLGMKPWLPKVITDRSLSRVDFHRVVTTVAPWLEKAEGIMRPRLTFMAHRPAVYLVGLVSLIMAIILFLPIPLGNMLPSLVLCILALGILERDGVWILIGLGAAVASVMIVWGVLWAIVFGALFVITNWFGFSF